MATNNKIPSQGNLVDMLAAFGRGALGTLTDRFNQYDAALESVAAHEGQIASINQGKTSWANGGTVTSETYYNILKGTQDSFTLPFDLNGFISGITANGNAQRYSGVIIAVSYANTSEQPKQHSDTLYLPFAAVNAEKGVVAFEDLQFHYTDLAGTNVDVRYKVMPAPNSQIKLEKVKESANKPDTPTAAAKPLTFLIRGDGGDTLDNVALEEFTLTPTQMTDGSVDGFQINLPDSVEQQLFSLVATLKKYQNPGSSAICVAQKDPIDMLPRFMLSFYDGDLAYPFDVVKSAPGDYLPFVLKGDIPTTSGDFAKWVVTVNLFPNNSSLVFKLIK